MKAVQWKEAGPRNRRCRRKRLLRCLLREARVPLVNHRMTTTTRTPKKAEMKERTTICIPDKRKPRSSKIKRGLKMTPVRSPKLSAVACASERDRIREETNRDSFKMRRKRSHQLRNVSSTCGPSQGSTTALWDRLPEIRRRWSSCTEATSLTSKLKTRI